MKLLTQKISPWDLLPQSWGHHTTAMTLYSCHLSHSHTTTAASPLIPYIHLMSLVTVYRLVQVTHSLVMQGTHGCADVRIYFNCSKTTHFMTRYVLVCIDISTLKVGIFGKSLRKYMKYACIYGKICIDALGWQLFQMIETFWQPVWIVFNIVQLPKGHFVLKHVLLLFLLLSDFCFSGHQWRTFFKNYFGYWQYKSVYKCLYAVYVLETKTRTLHYRLKILVNAVVIDPCLNCLGE